MPPSPRPVLLRRRSDQRRQAGNCGHYGLGLLIRSSTGAHTRSIVDLRLMGGRKRSGARLGSSGCRCIGVAIGASTAGGGSISPPRQLTPRPAPPPPPMRSWPPQRRGQGSAGGKLRPGGPMHGARVTWRRARRRCRAAARACSVPGRQTWLLDCSLWQWNSHVASSGRQGGLQLGGAAEAEALVRQRPRAPAASRVHHPKLPSQCKLHLQTLSIHLRRLSHHEDMLFQATASDGATAAAACRHRRHHRRRRPPPTHPSAAHHLNSSHAADCFDGSHIVLHLILKDSNHAGYLARRQATGACRFAAERQGPPPAAAAPRTVLCNCALGLTTTTTTRQSVACCEIGQA